MPGYWLPRASRTGGTVGADYPESAAEP